MDYDVIIIGGGVAGMSAAQYCARANLNTLLVEKAAMGGQALVISDLENYPGFSKPVNGFDFAEAMEQQALNFGAKIDYLEIHSIRKENNTFTVISAEQELRSLAVILATGAEHLSLDIPGEKELIGRGVSYCASCDGPMFKSKKMLVIGGGDAACDEAHYLANLTNNIVMIHRRDKFRAQQALANRVLQNEHIDTRLNYVAREIIAENNKVKEVLLESTLTGKQHREDFDAVFIFIGSKPQTKFVNGIDKDETGYIITDHNMESSTSGFFAIGDVRCTPFRQIVVAASDGATAAHAVAAYIDQYK